MANKKRNNKNSESHLIKLALATATIDLVIKLIDLITKLIE